MNILITAGGTSEKVDCIRSITNRSTGEMARQIAEEYERRNDNIHFFYICSENAKLPQVQIPVDWCVHSRISGAPILK